ncbi:MAG: saccharopine dehydrogenase family protein [Leptolyngbyaceae cyanobacterium]
MGHVLILGGTGRIGCSIAEDLLAHSDVEIFLAGRQVEKGRALAARLGDRVQFCQLDLSVATELRRAIAAVDLVVHAAGPFHYRRAQVLRACIAQQVNYLDVSDYRGFTRQALALDGEARAAGITAIINAGVFPGISNSMVRQGVEALDQADSVQLSYVVAGSGGAGVTVMRTTFLGLQYPFDAWLDGRWQSVKPYTERERLAFPLPYGTGAVYWYDMPEAMTLANSFDLQNVKTKFGVVPDFYNQATWLMAHGLPSAVLRNSKVVEFLARVSYGMTGISDRFTGTGVAIRCDIQGRQNDEPTQYCSFFVHDSAAIAAGNGAGYIAALMMSRQLDQPGVFPVEQIVPTSLFITALQRRKLDILVSPLSSLTGDHQVKKSQVL